MKKILIILSVILTSISVVGCGSKKEVDPANISNEYETIEDLKDKTDEEILTFGEVQVPEFSISVLSVDKEQLYLTENDIKPLAVIKENVTRISENKETINFWQGVDFTHALRQIGIKNYTTLIITDLNGNEVEYSYDQARYSILAYGVDGKATKISSVVINENDDVWVEDIYSIVVKE